MNRVLPAAVAVYAIFAGAAAAACMPHKAVRDVLAADYQETPTAAGLDSRGVVIEVYTARDGSTWTILVVRPDGTACIAGSGSEWTAVTPGRGS